MADINHEIKIQASPEKTFKALSTLIGLKAWHTAHIDGKSELNGVLSFNGTGKPTFLWKIIQFESNKIVAWECVEGPGDSVGTQAVYTLSQTADDRTLVELSHNSWPDQQGNFRKCNTLWGILLHHLKNYVETGKIDPAIP
jgi:uncharacterized protein YndB with AHSA1/START domain